MRMLVSKLEDLNGRPLEIPEYRDAYKVFILCFFLLVAFKANFLKKITFYIYLYLNIVMYSNIFYLLTYY